MLVITSLAFFYWWRASPDHYCLSVRALIVGFATSLKRLCSIVSIIFIPFASITSVLRRRQLSFSFRSIHLINLPQFCTVQNNTLNVFLQFFRQCTRPASFFSSINSNPKAVHRHLLHFLINSKVVVFIGVMLNHLVGCSD